MSQRPLILPPLVHREQYARIQHDTQTWLPAMQVISQRHALAAAALARISEGSNIVFAADAEHIIKLYPPHCRQAAIVDHLVGKRA